MANIFVISRPTAIAPSALVFNHYAESIKNEEGIDVFEREAARKAEERIILQLFKRFLRERVFSQDFMDEAWNEYLRSKGMLTKEEQQTKDEFSLQIARDTKAALAALGMSDTARLGFCKRNGCANGKTERLLLRGFCPDCRGVSVKQTIAQGGTFSALVCKLADATVPELQTGLVVSVNRKKVHPATRQLTTEERKTLVLKTKMDIPSLSVSGLARKVGLPRKTVSDILKTSPVKTRPENTEEVKQFLEFRAEQQPNIKQYAHYYSRSRGLKNKKEEQQGAGPKATESGAKRHRSNAFGETASFGGSKGVEIATPQNMRICPSCLRSVLPEFHYWADGGCISSEKVSSGPATKHFQMA